MLHDDETPRPLRTNKIVLLEKVAKSSSTDEHRRLTKAAVRALREKKYRKYFVPYQRCENSIFTQRLAPG